MMSRTCQSAGAIDIFDLLIEWGRKPCHMVFGPLRPLGYKIVDVLLADVLLPNGYMSILRVESGLGPVNTTLLQSG